MMSDVVVCVPCTDCSNHAARVGREARHLLAAALPTQRAPRALDDRPIERRHLAARLGHEQPPATHELDGERSWVDLDAAAFPSDLEWSARPEPRLASDLLRGGPTARRTD